MYCDRCGTLILEEAAACGKCGRPVRAAAAAEAAAAIKEETGVAIKDALAIAKVVLLDPVGALRPTFDRLGVRKATAAGLALCLLFATAAAMGLRMIAHSGVGGFLGAMVFGEGGGVGSFLRILLAALVIPTALVVVSRGLFVLLGSRSPFGAELFSTGAALTPLGLAVLAAGFLGAGNFEVIALVLFFGMVYLVLMLFIGLTELGGLTLKSAAPSLPLLLLASAWLSKVAFVAIFL
jgi:hypothetical protein